MLISVFDTETSGLPLFNEPSEDVRQPHICEIAAYLFNTKTLALEESYYAIVKQDGWAVDPKAFEAHGITKERSMSEGIDEVDAVHGFLRLHDKCDLRVAHNEDFDQRIMRIALKRFGTGINSHPHSMQEVRDTDADLFKAFPRFCTMKTSTPILNLPATPAMVKSGRGSWKKSPTLAEAHRHFFGEEFDGAHSARSDAWAAARLFFKLTQNADIGRFA